ncbi:unnamed protein product, partial [Heterotrigona itama]
MSALGNHAFWKEFIELYKSFPCLWDVRSKSYMDRNSRNDAINVLVEKCKEINPLSNKDFVNKKIHNMRCSFRRELKKVKQSRSKHTSQDNVYIPSLWYFDILSFITDCDPWRNTDNFNDVNINLKSDCDDDREQDEIQTEMEDSPSSEVPSRLHSSSVRKTVRKRKRECEGKKSQSIELHKISNDVTSNTLNREDIFDITGKKIACDLRELNEQQRIIAEKLINDVIYYAKL